MKSEVKLKHYTDSELRAIAVVAVQREQYKKTMPSTLYGALAQGLLVAQGILPLGDRSTRLAAMLQQLVLEQK